MTSEIAIMNKEAVALAADSAVTASLGKDKKVFVSANKIFALSKYNPVGIMVYGSASFMGIPWETIVKLYRSELGKRSYKTLEDYANDFIAFLYKESRFSDENEQKRFLGEYVYSFFYYLRNKILEKINSFCEKKGRIDEDEVGEIVKEVIRKEHETWMGCAAMPSMPEDFFGTLRTKYTDIIEKAKQDVFEEFLKFETISAQLNEIALNLFAKFPPGIDAPRSSGIVIAGFGAADIFPSLKSFTVEGIIGNALKYKVENSYNITVDNDAVIFPFAQSEMVNTFMEGIDPNFMIDLENLFAQIFHQFPGMLIKSIDGLDDSKKMEIERKLEQVGEEEFKKLLAELINYRRERYISPVIGIVGHLPKDEMAAMAESFVNLTLIKKKMSFATETVGGPVDVVVISRGDGLIWIKRKHYFKSELNRQFLNNYFGEVQDEEQSRTKR